MGTSFLYTSILQRTKTVYIKITLQVCDKESLWFDIGGKVCLFRAI